VRIGGGGGRFGRGKRSTISFVSEEIAMSTEQEGKRRGWEGAAVVWPDGKEKGNRWPGFWGDF